MDTFGILRGFGEEQEKTSKSCVINIMVSHQYLAQAGLDSLMSFWSNPLSRFPYSKVINL
jgi:hypothetical protein